MAKEALTVLQLTEVQAGKRKSGQGDWHKLSFKAKKGEEEHWYQTFKTDLISLIQQSVNKTIECDIEITETENGTNRIISEIYVDGQPVGKKAGGKGAYYGRQYNPEEQDRIDARHAIETIRDVWMGDLFSKPIPDEAKDLMLWCQQSIRKFLKVNGTVVKPETKQPEAKILKEASAKEKLLAEIGARLKHKSFTTTRSWLIGVCKIPAEQLDSDDLSWYEEVKKKQGWTD